MSQIKIIETQRQLLDSKATGETVLKFKELK